jgi:hypothetical protein
MADDNTQSYFDISETWNVRALRGVADQKLFQALSADRAIALADQCRAEYERAGYSIVVSLDNRNC